MPDTPLTGAQARASEAAAALDKVAIAVADAVAVVADLNVSLTHDRQKFGSARGEEAFHLRVVDAPVPMSAYVDFEPGLAFADWRCEVLSLLEAS